MTTGTAARQFDGIDIEAFYEMQKLYVELGVISVDQIVVAPGTEEVAQRVTAEIIAGTNNPL